MIVFLIQTIAFHIKLVDFLIESNTFLIETIVFLIKIIVFLIFKSNHTFLYYRVLSENSIMYPYCSLWCQCSNVSLFFSGLNPDPVNLETFLTEAGGSYIPSVRDTNSFYQIPNKLLQNAGVAEEDQEDTLA